jgi:hypothetical protein
MAATRYADIRNQLMRQSFPSIFAPAVLRDADTNYIPLPISERLVQCIWYDQRVQPLQTLTGETVTVIFPGWWNLEAGPDFRHATIRIGDGPELTGDVEIHLRADDWTHHGHGRDPLYDNVMLHVVLWEAGSDFAPRSRHGDAIPQVVLQNQLAAPLDQLYDEIDLEAYPHAAPGHGGSCSAVLKTLPSEAVASLLESAGDERFTSKTRKFSRWVHRLGPEQAFYEGWMEALGYKANKSAFRALAQRLPVAELDRKNLAPIFFGVANFLPTTFADAGGKRLWGRWWKLRPDFEDKVLPKEAWRLNGVRPANHPHRRLGAAVALLKRHRNLLDKVTGAVESGGDPGKFFHEIRDDYWSYHFTLGGKPQRKASELIGEARAEEIVANVVLPFVAALGDARLTAAAKTRYDSLRRAPGNSVLRLAGQQLFESAAAATRFLRTTRQQQGLMQIFQDFCLQDKSACRQCKFPELAQRWAVSSSE